MRNQGTENSSNLPKVTELVSGRARGQIQGLYSPEPDVPSYEGNHQYSAGQPDATATDAKVEDPDLCKMIKRPSDKSQERKA